MRRARGELGRSNKNFLKNNLYLKSKTFLVKYILKLNTTKKCTTALLLKQKASSRLHTFFRDTVHRQNILVAGPKIAQSETAEGQRRAHCLIDCHWSAESILPVFDCKPHRRIPRLECNLGTSASNPRQIK